EGRDFVIGWRFRSTDVVERAMRPSGVLMMLSLCLPAGALMAQAPASAPVAPAPAPASAAAAASARPGPVLNATQQAQLARQDEEMTRAAQRVAQLVDANQAAQVWDGASAVARKAVTR